MKRYFYITIHFSPEREGTVLIKGKDGLYRDIQTEELYRKRLLYDFGWGQESGFELLPPLPFARLIELVECVPPQESFQKKPCDMEMQQEDIWRSNLYGAVAVIMQDHIEEFVDFLSKRIDTDYFSNPTIRENFKCFSFDSQKARTAGRIPGGVLTESYEDILKRCPQWEKLSQKVLHQIYG